MTAIITSVKCPISAKRNLCNRAIELMLSFIFDGKLAWKGLLGGKRDYSSVLLDVDEVIGLVRSGPDKSGFTKAELTRFIPGLTRAAVAPLVNADHLTMTEEYSKEARRLVPVVSRLSAEAFKERFVTLGELCGTVGLHHKQVCKILSAAGVSATFDERMGVECFLYDRLSAQQALSRVGSSQSLPGSLRAGSACSEAHERRDAS